MSAHQIHFDPAVNDLIARERRAAAAEALREVEAVVRHWERTPALRRGTAAAEIRRALHRATAETEASA